MGLVLTTLASGCASPTPGPASNSTSAGPGLGPESEAAAQVGRDSTSSAPDTDTEGEGAKQAAASPGPQVVEGAAGPAVPDQGADPAAQGDADLVGQGSARDDPDRLLADVIGVRGSGSSGRYTFSVRLRSPDTGCERYADYWEVLSEEGELLYRRILAHSHPDEQPFTRSGGPVAIDRVRTVFVRAHMHPGGHGGAAMRGSVAEGFTATELPSDFAPEVAAAPPQPTPCAF